MVDILRTWYIIRSKWTLAKPCLSRRLDCLSNTSTAAITDGPAKGETTGLEKVQSAVGHAPESYRYKVHYTKKASRFNAV
jgi:hypothetical protein